MKKGRNGHCFIGNTSESKISLEWFSDALFIELLLGNYLEIRN